MAVSNESWIYAQQSVLGSMLIDSRCVPTVMQCTTERNFQGPHLTLYRAIRKLFQNGVEIDPVIVLNAIGGEYKNFLLELMDITPTAANVERYCDICRKESQNYNLRELGRQMAETEDDGALRKLAEDINGVLVGRNVSRGYSMTDLLKSFFERHTGEPNYLRWPIRELDGEIYASPGSFIVLGGMPSTGKTLFGLQCARFWAKDRKVGFFSLETDEHTVMDRHMASITGISKDLIKKNQLSQNEWDKICSMSQQITSLNMEIIPAAGFTVADIKAYTLMKGFDVIFVDYLQLIDAPGEHRTAIVTSVSIGLHTLAQSLGVTVVALSQLNRDNGQSRSELARLRESGQIEQDADVVMLLSLEHENRPEGNRILSIAKNKEGTRPKICLAFDGIHQTFSKGMRTKEVQDQMTNDGKKARRINREQSQYQGEQMTMRPNDTPVPFQ